MGVTPPVAPFPCLDEFASEVCKRFESRFSRPASVVVAAPGRVNLIGEHLDYNDGFVLPMAIDRYTVVAATALPTSSAATARVYSTQMDEEVELPLTCSAEETPPGWARYVAGVLNGFEHRGTCLPSFAAIVDSHVPLGGGLSSSAALEVATATLAETLASITLEPREKALLCQQAEHEYAGMPCGVMDQFSSVFGQTDRLLLIDCRSLDVQMVPFEAPDISILITNSHVNHELTGSEYGLRREQCHQALQRLGKSSWRDVNDGDLRCLQGIQLRRARHVVQETERTRSAAQAAEAACWQDFGELMYASHRSLRDDYQVSCRELDLLVDLARQIGTTGGVLGSRMTGGGFGGCTVSLVETGAVPEVSQRIRQRYQQATGILPDCFATRPSQGAHRIGI